MYYYVFIDGVTHYYNTKEEADAAESEAQSVETLKVKKAPATRTRSRNK